MNKVHISEVGGLNSSRTHALVKLGRETVFFLSHPRGHVCFEVISAREYSVEWLSPKNK